MNEVLPGTVWGGGGGRGGEEGEGRGDGSGGVEWSVVTLSGTWPRVLLARHGGGACGAGGVERPWCVQTVSTHSRAPWATGQRVDHSC